MGIITNYIDINQLRNFTDVIIIIVVIIIVVFLVYLIVVFVVYNLWTAYSNILLIVIELLPHSLKW